MLNSPIRLSSSLKGVLYGYAKVYEVYEEIILLFFKLNRNEVYSSEKLLVNINPNESNILSSDTDNID